jgi:hypothetical protein
MAVRVTDGVWLFYAQLLQWLGKAAQVPSLSLQDLMQAWDVQGVTLFVQIRLWLRTQQLWLQPGNSLGDLEPNEHEQ